MLMFSPFCCVLRLKQRLKLDGRRVSRRDGSEDPDEFTSELSSQGDRDLDCLLTSSTPRGLVDGLSKFFTPSNRRTSRVSVNAVDYDVVRRRSRTSEPKTMVRTIRRIVEVVTAGATALDKAHPCKRCSHRGRNGSIGGRGGLTVSPKVVLERRCRGGTPTSGRVRPSRCRVAGMCLVRRSKLRRVSRGQRTVGATPGSTQLRGLLDGLSDFFAVRGDRKRDRPVYNPVVSRGRRRRCVSPDRQTVTGRAISPEHGGNCDSELGFSSPETPVRDVCLSDPVRHPDRAANVPVVRIAGIAGGLSSVGVPCVTARRHRGDSDCDADSEDEGDDVEEEERRCTVINVDGVKLRPSGSCSSSETGSGTDTSCDSDVGQEVRSASRATTTSSSSSGLGPGHVERHWAAQDEGKILVSWASCCCLSCGGLALCLP